MRRRWVMLALVALVAGCGGGGHDEPRTGLIVPHHSIDRLELGMTEGQVQRLFGEPDSRVPLSESESGKPIVDWRYDKRGLKAEFREVKGDRLTLAGIFTTSPRERTKSGVGVGTSEDVLRKKLSGLDCNPEPNWCTLGNGGIDSTQTIFAIKNGRVREAWVITAFP
jgi:hypothetical protein